METDWSHREHYIWNKHQMKTQWADEASDDPGVVVFDPDPASKSGNGARFIGYSHSINTVVTVILVPKDRESDSWWGANTWRSNDIDRRIYRRESQ